MGTNTTNTTTTVKKQTEWKINLVIQPDPFAATVDNKATQTAATGTSALAAVNKVTSTSHGALTATNMVAADITEVAIKLKSATGTGGALKIFIGGSTDVGGYVYCGVSKTGTRRRMLNTTNTTNSSNTTSSTTAAKIPNLQSAEAAA